MPEVTKDYGKVNEILKKGGVVVLKTDTLYGIIANALDKKTVERVYKIKGRRPDKPFIILVPSVDDIKRYFDVEISNKERELLEKRGITVVLNLRDRRKHRYLHRGTGTLAFRIPSKDKLIELLKKTGFPVVAPSANPEGKKPAVDINEAIRYFGDKIDLYVDEEKAEGKASPIVKVEDGKVIYLRR